MFNGHFTTSFTAQEFRKTTKTWLMQKKKITAMLKNTVVHNKAYKKESHRVIRNNRVTSTEMLHMAENSTYNWEIPHIILIN